MPLLIACLCLMISILSGCHSYASPISQNPKLYIFLTVDVETPSGTQFYTQKYGQDIFLTGAPMAEQPALPLVMSMLEKHRFKGSFFLDACEAGQHPAGAFQEIARSIDERGHEVDLHCHANKLKQGKGLADLSLQEQIQTLSKGKQDITSWTGVAPAAFRAGAYLLNDDTLTAINHVEIPIDSSVFDSHRNNHCHHCGGNQVTLYDHVIEIPITSAKRLNKTRKTKMDINWMKPKDLESVIQQAKQAKEKKLVFIMHSFSLMNFTRKAPYVPISVNEQRIDELEAFLTAIDNDPDIEVVTFGDWLERTRFHSLKHYEPEFKPTL